MNRFPNWQKPEFDALGKTKWNWMCQHHQNLSLRVGSDIGAFTNINDKHGVEIGAGAKIGSHTVIFPGVTIGANALVGAHSLVKTDIPDNEVWAGVPARKLK